MREETKQSIDEHQSLASAIRGPGHYTNEEEPFSTQKL